MAFLEDITKNATPTGFVTAIGAALLAPVLAPAVGQILRPAGKVVMRTGITLYRSTVEPISAAVGGLVSEARHELASAPAGTATTAEPEAADKPATRTQKRQRAHHA